MAWRHGVRWFLNRRRWSLYFGIVFGLFSLVVLFYAEEKWRGKRAWAAANREMSAHGEQFNLGAIIPPTVPDDENFAMTPALAALFDYETVPWGPAGNARWRNNEVIERLQSMQLPMSQKSYYRSWLDGEFVDLQTWQHYFQTNGVSAATSRQPAEDVLQALAKYEPVFNELRQAARRPYSRFPVQYEKGLLAERPHWAVLKNLGHLLRLRSVAQLAMDRPSKAFEDFELSLLLANSLKDEPSFFAQYLRQEMILEALQPIWEGLADHRWSEAQLAAVQDNLAPMNLLADYAPAWRAEIVLFIDIGNQLLAAGERKHAPLPRQGGPADKLLALYPSGWIFQDQAQLYRFYRNGISALMLDPVRQRLFVPRIAEAGAWLASSSPGFQILVRPKLQQMLRDGTAHFALTQTAVNEALVGCALERYRLETGQFPERTETLVPKYLSRLPHDIVNGQPLKYQRRSESSFVLYSVGWDETDEGGKPGPPIEDWRQRMSPAWQSGDWVWIHPAAR